MSGAREVAEAGDKVWYEDVRVLYERWTEFFPRAEQTPAERVNALVRLIAYATLASFVYNREPRTLVLGACVVAVVSVAFGHRRQEAFPTLPAPLAPPAPNTCTPPTRDNPFANVLLTDLGKPRAPACDYNAVKDQVRDNFNAGLFRNATDLNESQNSQHQFHTLPVTTGMANTGAFANFLYGNMRNCKKSQQDCHMQR